MPEADQQGKLHRVTHSGEVNALLTTLMEKPWVVFAKTCLQGARSVVDYLGRYTHRIALSDGRLAHMDNDHVSFYYRDYRDNQKKCMTLDGTEFLRRFLQHVLPKGFMRVRHFGWLANANRAKILPQVRAAIAARKAEAQLQKQPQKRTVPTGFEGIPCSCCKQSLMVVCALLKPTRLEGR